jgi:hypothetical protein
MCEGEDLIPSFLFLPFFILLFSIKNKNLFGASLGKCPSMTMNPPLVMYMDRIELSLTKTLAI